MSKRMSYVGFRLIHPPQMMIWIAFCLFSLLPCLTQFSFAQPQDRQFREFDRTMVHSPTEMFRDLSKLISQDSNNPLADLDPETIKKLNKLGKEFIENLDDEQKKKAQEFAEKFLREKGLSSPEGKALMNQFGVSPEMQEQLAKEFDELSSADLEKFRELINEQNPGSGLLNGLPPRPDIPNREPGKAGDGKTGDGKTGNSSVNPQSTRQGPATDPGTRNGQSPAQDPFNDNQFEPNSDSRENGLRENGVAKKAGEQNGNLGQPENGKLPRPDVATDNTPEDRLKNGLQELPNLNGTGDPAKGLGSENTQPTGVGESGQANLEMLQDLAKRMNAERDRVKRDSQPNRPSAANSKNGNGNSNRKTTPSMPPGLNDQFDEQFQSWLKSQAIEKRFRDWQDSSGASELQNRSLEAALKKGFKGLGRSIGNTLGEGTTKGLSKRELNDKLDRVLFEAAKDGLNPQSEASADGLSGSVDTAIDGFLDRFHEAMSKRQSDKRARSKREREARRQKRAESGGDEKRDGIAPAVPGSTSGSSRTGGGSSPLGGSLGSSTAVLEHLPEIPAMNFQKVLMFLALVGLGGFMVYLLMRNYVGDVAMSPARKFGKSFRTAKIRSPKDLVEAVDYFIVTKFGSESRWWNAKHAQEILCAGAPGYSAKISNLLRDYVRARYTRSDAPLPDEAQQNYKATLQELSKQDLPAVISIEPEVIQSLPNQNASPPPASQAKVD